MRLHAIHVLDWSSPNSTSNATHESSHWCQDMRGSYLPYWWCEWWSTPIYMGYWNGQFKENNGFSSEVKVGKMGSLWMFLVWLICHYHVCIQAWYKWCQHGLLQFATGGGGFLHAGYAQRLLFRFADWLSNFRVPMISEGSRESWLY